MIKASIITIGDELLIGQTIDTNSAWMAQELNKAGIWVQRRVAVGDVWDDIWQTLDAEAAQSHIVLITGGLGPTADDITKPLLCKYFNGNMIVHPETLERVKHIFEVLLKRPLLERNLKQAEVPDTCQVITNHKGTAPGMWFEKAGVVFVSMPGVPFEMKEMMSREVMPLLQGHFKPAPIFHRTLLTAGAGESFIAERLVDFEAQLPAHIKLAYLPHFGLVRLRLTATGAAATEAEVQSKFGQLQQLVNDIMVVNEDISLHQAVANLLLAANATLAIAESCTGGYISHQITSLAGSSNFFIGSVVSYANDVKNNLLDVQQATLAQHGAVSEATVREMAAGVREKMNTQYAVATSGIMGPGGGSEDKPVGTVWIAIASATRTTAQRFHFRFDRQRNIELTTMQALNMLRLFVLEDSAHA
jgi:nicotinamide-nucleotide amidase